MICMVHFLVSRVSDLCLMALCCFKLNIFGIFSDLHAIPRSYFLLFFFFLIVGIFVLFHVSVGISAWAWHWYFYLPKENAFVWFAASAELRFKDGEFSVCTIYYTYTLFIKENYTLYTWSDPKRLRSTSGCCICLFMFLISV